MDVVAREQRIQTLCLLIIAAFAVGVTLYWLSAVMIPFVLALFLAFSMAPLIRLLTHTLRLPRMLAVLVTMLLGFVALNLLGALVTTSVGQLTQRADLYQTTLAELLQRAAHTMERFDVRLGKLDPYTVVAPATIGAWLLGTTNAMLGILSQGVLVLVFVFFLLMGRATEPRPQGDMWGEMVDGIQRYLLTKLVISGVVGLLVGATLALLGVDLAIVFGLFTFVLNFIPNIGPLIATLLPLPVVLVSPEISSGAATLAILIPTGLHVVIGNLVEPMVMGDSLDLHPVAVLLALMIWGALWGVAGMLLAAPMTAILKLLFERLEITAPLADLLAGRYEAPRRPPALRRAR